jgi:Holliday junction resolvase
MGKSQRDKGNRGERQLVNIFRAYGIEAKRVPLSGAAAGFKGDVIATIQGSELRIESKVRGNGFKQIYGWLDGNDALVIKADRQQALIVMPLRKFCELVGEVDEHDNN